MITVSLALAALVVSVLALSLTVMLERQSDELRKRILDRLDRMNR